MVKPLRNGRRRDKCVHRLERAAAWWRHELIVDPVKLTEPVWKNSGTLAHVFSAVGAPPSVLTQPSSPHGLNFRENHLVAEAFVRMRCTKIYRYRSWPFFWLWVFSDKHTISLSIFALICILCLYTGSSHYILVLGEKLAVLAPTPPLQSTPRACC